MDQNEHIEVRTVKPVAEIPISESKYFVKTLSTIPECESSKVSRIIKEDVSHSINSKSNVENLPTPKERIDSLQDSNAPFDIDLLLRRYACNSNMAKSIKEVLGRTDDPISEASNRGPLLELGAACKIFTFLKQSSSNHSLLSTLRYRDALTKLESLIRGYSKETLQEFLSIDPSMRMCKHCGVISCERSSDISIGSRRSPPKTSYFLSTKILSDIVKNGEDKLVTHRRVRRISSKKGRMTKRVGNYVKENTNSYPSRELSSNVDRDDKSCQRIKIMAAERENGGETSQQLETISNSEARDGAKNDTIANVKNNLLYDSYFNRVNYTNEFIHYAPNNKPIKQETLSNSPLSVHKSDEKIVKDILYENSQLHLDDIVEQDCVSLRDKQAIKPLTITKQNQVMNIIEDITPPNSKKNFVLHRISDYNPYPNSEYLIRHKFMSSNKTIKNRDKSSNILSNDSQNYLEQCKYMEPIKNIQQFSSFPYLIEDDSLENCVKVSRTLEQPNESNTTVCSSSSAENMIRKWIKVPGNNTLSIDEKQRSDVFSKNYPSERTVSNVVNGSFKFWNSQESIKNKMDAQDSNDIQIRGSKKSFTKHLLGCFKNIASIKSIKSKEIDTNAKPPSSSGNSLLGDGVKNISRRIIYKESSFKDAINDDENYNKVNDILLLYRKILEGTEGMDWQSFQRFVEHIHPSHKDSWRDICKSINDNAKRVADENGGGTEICIEISSVTSERFRRETETCGDEIVFEMDITLGDVERCLGSQRAFSEKEQLGGFESASELTKV
ncbi:uncharacterized protein LOC143428637 [Xylocopa sonorina]|uniref:uncharacterized protein LOC143428637 n=1 Tax=Xylocopa sonorina TaxID=1818115 RepID=UPI00403A9588